MDWEGFGGEQSCPDWRYSQC